MYRTFGSIFAAGAIGSWFSRELLKTWFFERVLEAMSPYIAVPISLIVEYAPPMALSFVALYLLVGEQKRHAINYWARRKVNPYLAMAAVAGVVAIVALILYWADRARGPIQWVLHSEGSPITFSRLAAAQPVVFAGFHIMGHNKSDDPIPMGSAFIRSDVTGQKVRLVIGVPGGNIDPSEGTAEPDGRVLLYGQFPLGEQPKPISVDEFRKEFGRFTFHFEYADGRAFEKSYSSNEVDDLIAKALGGLERISRTPPGVIRNR
jgi:hypothetical protein